MYSYWAYGLNIHSDLALPELVDGEETREEGERDVLIRLGRVDPLPFEANDTGRHIRPTPQGVYLSWQGVGRFLVRDGCEIVVDPLPGVEERVVRLFILGTTFAVLLHQREGIVVLHASVAVISDQAVAFVGAKHAGKSTMVATLHALGHELVADDILAVDMRQGGPVALPGFPHLKLWPDTVVSLGYAPDLLPRLRSEVEKRGRRLAEGFAREPVPLRCIYELGSGSAPEIEPIRRQEAMIRLMPHWYGARFGSELLHALGLSTHFLQCATLASKVAVCRLKRPRSLSLLPDVARLVEAHLASGLQRVPEWVAGPEQRAEPAINFVPGGYTS